MKAKIITMNFKRRNNYRGNRGYSVGRKWRLYRGFMTNDQVRYLTCTGAVMFVSDGEHQLVHFKTGTTSHHSLVDLKG